MLAPSRVLQSTRSVQQRTKPLPALSSVPSCICEAFHWDVGLSAKQPSTTLNLGKGEIWRARPLEARTDTLPFASPP